MHPAESEGVPGGAAGLPLLRRTGSLPERLVVLMGARLALAVVSLGIVLALEAAVGDLGEDVHEGLFGTVAVVFLATALQGVALPRIRRPERFAAFNIATDVALVSSLVHFSGGSQSVFSFLYVLVAVYAALLFDRRGALTTAGGGALAYAAVLAWEHSTAGAAGRDPTILVSIWAAHFGAIALAAALASFLSAELRRTGEALRERTRDLRRLEDLHQRTVQSLMSGLLTTDPEGRVTSFNPEAARITGWSAGEAIGRDVDEILPGLREPGPMASQPRTRIPYHNRQDDELWLGVGAYVLRDAHSEPGGWVVIFQDVTEVVAMELELRRSERLAAVGELAASIAHEVRNPLAAISGSIQMLERQAGVSAPEGEGRRLMGIALRETERLDGLISDFIEYARPRTPEPEAVALRPVLADVVELLSASEQVELELDVPDGLGAWVDPDQLRQIVWNLAINGSQAMPEGGRLRVCARILPGGSPQGAPSGGRNEGEEKSAQVEISVSDEGMGIPAEALESVFDPFFTTKRDGTGLGLATVHRIVEEHGGSVRVESGPGRGTIFRIRLPIAEVSA